MSTSAEEALTRAKAIAARLSGLETNSGPTPSLTGTSPESTTTGTTGKRKRWGVAPTTMTATEPLPGLAEIAKRMKQEVEPIQKRLWVATSSGRPPSHFLSYLPTRLEELVNQVLEENGSSESNDKTLSLSLKGRGSSRKPPPPGMPEEPMHVLIRGQPHLVTKVEPLVDSLLTEAEKAPLEVLEPLDSSSDNKKTGTSTALTTVSQSSEYRPATVAQLIAQNPNLLEDGEDMLEEQIGVPNGVVGYLIGRGGETITSMQARSGCKIQIQKEHELQPGQTQRIITLSAPNKESIDQCRGMIESMVQDRIRAAGGSTTAVVTSSGGTGGTKEVKVTEAIAAGHALVKVDVPDADVGLIIGKGGSTIKTIQDTTGASIQIPPSGNADNPSMRTVSITHPNEEGAQLAKQQIEDILKSKPSYASSQGQQITIHVLVSAK